MASLPRPKGRQELQKSFYYAWQYLLVSYYFFRPDVDQQSQASQGNHAPAMMTFKQFLNAQDDNIGDEEAFNKYQEYKLEFRKTQMSDFFQQHKEEEWYVVHVNHTMHMSMQFAII